VRNTLILSLCAALLGLCACKKQEAATARPGMGAGGPATPVSVARAVQQDVPTELRVVGTAEASAIVQVKSQLGGQLMKTGFAEGQNVARGELLFQIDPRPYQDALRQAEAAVERDRTQIAQAQAVLARDQAQAKYNETDAARQEQLHKESLASRMQADQARTALDVSQAAANATRASVDTARAALAADQAAVSRARLDLTYCEIRSPIAGRTGNLLVQPGNLVKANDIPLVVIHQVAPIFVNFSVPERHLAAIRRLSAGRRLEVRAIPQDNAAREARGRLVVVDNTVDTTTGTIKLKAEFENRDSLLWPGQFVTAVLTLDTIPGAIVVPTEAVQAGQRGSFIYVVKPDNAVEARLVKTGEAFGGRTVIEQGLAAGDTVVTDGQLRLFPGAPVRIVDAGKIGTGPL
jgi:multidrug efflux system membrane fusion protein